MPQAPPTSLSARQRNLSAFQVVVLLLIFAGLAVLICASPGEAGLVLSVLLANAFIVAVGVKTAALFATPRQRKLRPVAPLRNPPAYTVILALKDEAELIPQLYERLRRLNYPAKRLHGYVVMEPTDTATLRAARMHERPAWVSILETPGGAPETKPRALNVALAKAQEGLVCVFDAEDDPHPDQLMEAATRFSDADANLACLQAPLRVRTAGLTWMERQFAAEYCALFDVLLPSLARARLPLPLGGTSNHFRVEALKQIGGWDPYNVTEDADIGFRLARAGFRTTMIERPTFEPPTGGLRHWLPQRTRWLKGFMQTWGVHTRDPRPLGMRGSLAFALTIGLPIAAALVQAIVIYWIAAAILTSAIAGMPAQLEPHFLALAAAGWLSGAAACWVGARRAGAPYGVWDALTAPIYWALSSLALAHAIKRLITEPFYWDKTQHQPDDAPSSTPVVARLAAP